MLCMVILASGCILSGNSSDFSENIHCKTASSCHCSRRQWITLTLPMKKALLLLVLCFIQVASALAISVGDRVQAVGSGLNIRSTYSTTATRYGGANYGNTGTVIGGPVYSAGYTWWQIRWDAPVSLTGWSVDYSGGVTLQTLRQTVAQVATPTISPYGTSTTGPVNVSISSATSGATLRYTVNGSDPTANSPIYSGTITLTASATVKAKAFKSGMTDSATASASYSIVIPVQQRVATPTITPGSLSASAPVNVSITCATGGATIYYSINGSDPTTASTKYTGAFSVPSSATVKAKAIKGGMTDSATASATYSIIIPVQQRVAMPVITPGSLSTTGPVTVSITCAAPNPIICYTTNGTEPTSSSPRYYAPFTQPVSGTIKAKAFKSGMTDSLTASATYTIIVPVRVVLLLHGMNADETSWNDFVKDIRYWKSASVGPATLYTPLVAPTISGGVIVQNQQTVPVPDKFGVYYYRVKFGYFDSIDAISRTGIEDASSKAKNYPGTTGGDFESFNDLAAEVDWAVSAVKKVHKNAEILLVSHSRGGLAARAYLQNTSYDRSAVVGLLTTGTPHNGSPLARLYNYFNTNKRPPAGQGYILVQNPVRLQPTPLQSDWNVVDFLRNPPISKLDIRRPVIQDVATNSEAISSLNKNINNLPSSAKYGYIAYDGARLGLLWNLWNNKLIMTSSQN